MENGQHDHDALLRQLLDLLHQSNNVVCLAWSVKKTATHNYHHLIIDYIIQRAERDKEELLKSNLEHEIADLKITLEDESDGMCGPLLAMIY